MEHVSDMLKAKRQELFDARDGEIQMASEVLGQYVTDHNDKSAYREIDRKVNKLARAWDKMIALLDKAIERAEAIEQKSDDFNFYGD
jgi:hypothetical protein